MSEISNVKRLCEFVKLIKGKAPLRAKCAVTETETYLTPDYLRGKAEAHQIILNSNSVRIGAGETLVLWDGSNAGEIFRSKSGILPSTMMQVVHGEEYAKEYFYYALKSYEDYLKGQTSGSGIPHVDKEILGNIKIRRYPLLEQKKIAEVLSITDRAIEQTEALIAKQQRIRTGLMQVLLTRGIDEHGNLRSESTHAFNDSPIGRIPNEWQVSMLGEVAEFVTSGSRGWARYYATEGALFLRIGNLTREHVDMRFDDVVRVAPPKTSEGKRTSVLAGDLLISITADLGIIGVIPGGFEEAYVNQHIALVRVLKTAADPRFLGWFLAGRGGQTQFEKLNESGAKAGLNLPAIRNLLVPKMQLTEQKKIAFFLDEVTRTSALLQSRHTKLQLLKRGLMQDLLTGRVRVTPLLEKTESPA